MSEQREELRLALVMNGGVSLAVWMGGVSNEIFRVVTQQHPVYAALLDMTHTTARVDVISGTSAGGINGAALSLALLYGGEFSKLRNVWLKTGAFAKLLRPPVDDNPGSLLRGEAYFLPEILQAFENLAQEPRPVFSPQEMPIDLRLTTTLLRGEQGHSVDDLGTPIHDVDYRGQFRFCHAAGHSDFDVRQPLIAALSRASRSTSSFPFAFEPSPVIGMAGLFLDAQDRPIAASRLGDLPDGVEVPRYVVDGGVLNNKPFRGALRSIFAMPAQRGVRRVLAYINPDPGDGPPGKPIEDAPPLSSVIGASLFGIPQSQSIADQLAEIQAHNDHVRSRRNSVISTVLTLSPEVLDVLPGALFAIYRQRRLVATFDGFVYGELPAAAARRAPHEPSGAVVGQRGRARLQATFMAVNWRGWIPPAWPTDWQAYRHDLRPCEDLDWEWGLYPVEFAIKVLLDVLRRAQHLCDFDAELQVPAAASQDTARVANASNATGTADWDDPPYRVPEAGNAEPRDFAARLRSRWGSMARSIGVAGETVASWDRETVRSATVPAQDPARSWLWKSWRSAYRCVASAERMRAQEQPVWEANARILLERLEENGPEREPDVDAISGALFEELFAFLVTPGRRAQCGALVRRVALVLQRVCVPAIALSRRVQQRPDLREHDRAAARELELFLDWLVPEGEAAQQRCMTVCRLMQLEVIEHAHNAHDELEDDSLIELVQISGNATSPLGGPIEAAEKLLGLQLAHFGAFYKQSWRANDWIYGRLDGSERMVKILMNPDRLQRFYPDSASAMRRIADIACNSIASPVLLKEVQSLWALRGYAQRLQRELAFLDRPDAAVPDALPVATEVITLRLHFGILREEIDTLLAAIAADRAEGADALGASEAFVQRFARNADDEGRRTLPFSPEQARLALNDGLIAGKNGENLLDEAGSDLFTRTLAHTVATLQGVLTSKAAKLGPVSLFFAALKLPVLGFYFVARGLTRQSRTSAALHGGILAIGIALVFAQLLLHGNEPKNGLPASLVAFGWAMLAYGLLFSIISSPRVVGPLMVLVILALAQLFDPDKLQIIGIALLSALAIWLSIRYRFFAFLQWLLGIGAVMLAALWSQPKPLTTELLLTEPVFRMAMLVCLVLLFASWQASTGARWAERAVRRLSRRRPS